LRHRIRFFQQLAILARAGVPLRASLQRLQDKIPGREVKILSKKLEDGLPIGEAFAAAGFSPFETHLVIAGERSAHLDDVFEHLSEFWDRQREMVRAIVNQLYYPVAVLVFSIVVSGIIEAVATSIPVAVIHGVEHLALLVAGGFIITVLIKVSWHSEAAQGFWLSLPLIGSTLSAAYAYRWIMALKLEFIAGISITQAVADAWRATGFVGRERLAREGQAAMYEGVQLSALVKRWKRLPRDWVDFIETGELSGKLENAFTSLEAEAARTWTNAQKRLADLLPKIIYFGILLIVAAQIFLMLYKLIVSPISDAEKSINDAIGQ
jgi:general secretion pathway protein F